LRIALEPNAPCNSGAALPGIERIDPATMLYVPR
jgi:hypothetical protein